MLIANPIYDVVFKYLLQDLAIARELLSAILGEEVISLDLKPQETAIENTAASVSILRFDFKGIIKTKSGAHKNVLIELQKAKLVFDVMRFRRYLSDNYRKEDVVTNGDGTVTTAPLPIVTIYFLGFLLENIQHAVVKVNREYRDVITQEVLNVKEDFVELLTHDSYLIQLRLLKGQSKSKLEKILQVFNPEYETEDRHVLDFQGDMNEPLVERIVARLERAITDEEIRDKMDVEDEIDRIFSREMGKLAAEKDKIIAAKDQELVAKDQELVAKDQELVAERKRSEAEKRKAEELLKQLEELRKRWNDSSDDKSGAT
jgi:hypothetical protein